MARVLSPYSDGWTTLRPLYLAHGVEVRREDSARVSIRAERRQRAPPLMASVSPVIQPASAEARNTTAGATS